MPAPVLLSAADTPRATAGESKRTLETHQPRGSGATRKTRPEAPARALGCDYGRQRTMGGAAPPAARGRAPRGREGGARGDRNVRAPEAAIPDTLRFLARELEAPAGRSGFPDAPLARISEARAARNSQEQYSPAYHRTL